MYRYVDADVLEAMSRTAATTGRRLPDLAGVLATSLRAAPAGSWDRAAADRACQQIASTGSELAAESRALQNRSVETREKARAYDLARPVSVRSWTASAARSEVKPVVVAVLTSLPSVAAWVATKQGAKLLAEHSLAHPIRVASALNPLRFGHGVPHLLTAPARHLSHAGARAAGRVAFGVDVAIWGVQTSRDYKKNLVRYQGDRSRIVSATMVDALVNAAPVAASLAGMALGGLTGPLAPVLGPVFAIALSSLAHWAAQEFKDSPLRDRSIELVNGPVEWVGRLWMRGAQAVSDAAAQPRVREAAARTVGNMLIPGLGSLLVRGS